MAMGRLDADRRLIRLVAVVALAAAVGFVAGRWSDALVDPPPAPEDQGTPSDEPIHLADYGGVYQTDTGIALEDLEPSQLPYPFTTPVPPETPTALDGAYLRIIRVEDLGAPKVVLPIRCIRCIPFRLDAGVSTLILYRGRYFLHHHLSDFKALGFYEIEGDQVTFFNDPNCPTSRGVYRWSRTYSQLQLHVIHDPCPFDELRAIDLTERAWTPFNHCIARFIGLWPGELGCSNRFFQP